MHNQMPFDDEKTSPTDYELRTQPPPVRKIKAKAVKAVAVLITSLVAIVIISDINSVKQHHPTNNSEMADTQQADPIHDDLLARLPGNYADVPKFEADRMRREMAKRRLAQVGEANAQASLNEGDASPAMPIPEVAKVLDGAGLDMNQCLVLLADGQGDKETQLFCARLLEEIQARKLAQTQAAADDRLTSRAAHTEALNGSVGAAGNYEKAWAEAEQAARISPLAVPVFHVQATGTTRSNPVTPSGEIGYSEADLAAQLSGLNRQDKYTDPNLQEEKRAFLKTTGNTHVSPHRLQSPASPYSLMAGSIIPVTLETGINSDLPGDITGIVRERVFDSVTGRYLLIPQGSRVLGVYDSVIAYGQERVLVVWTRIIMPNGESLALEGMKGVDLSGFAGYRDQVDHHYRRVIGSVILSSFLGVSTATLEGNRENDTVTQDFARAVGANINQAGQNILQKNLGIQPTITIRPGQSVNISVHQNLVLKPYHDRHNRVAQDGR